MCVCVRGAWMVYGMEGEGWVITKCTKDDIYYRGECTGQGVVPRVYSCVSDDSV